MFIPSMWKAFLRYNKLDREERRLFREALILLLLVRISLRTRGFQETNKDLQRRLKHAAASSRCSPDTVPKSCRMVAAGAKYGWGRPSCLERSLVLWYLLRKQSLPARLRIGVRNQAGKFEAHAWVEQDGLVLNESEPVHQHYAAFETEFSNLPEENV